LGDHPNGPLASGICRGEKKKPPTGERGPKKKLGHSMREGGPERGGEPTGGRAPRGDPPTPLRGALLANGFFFPTLGGPRGVPSPQGGAQIPVFFFASPGGTGVGGGKKNPPQRPKLSFWRPYSLRGGPMGILIGGVVARFFFRKFFFPEGGPTPPTPHRPRFLQKKFFIGVRFTKCGGGPIGRPGFLWGRGFGGGIEMGGHFLFFFSGLFRSKKKKGGKPDSPGVVYCPFSKKFGGAPGAFCEGQRGGGGGGKHSVFNWASR